MAEESTAHEVLVMTAQIVSAHVKANSVSPDALPDLIRDVHRAVSGLGAAPPPNGRSRPCPSANPYSRITLCVSKMARSSRCSSVI